MTYRLDSDIYHRFSYGITIPNNRQLPVSYPKVDKGSSARSVVHLQNEQQAAVKLKKKMVAWFVSNCKTASAREKYVEELSEYVAVDIYGKCGNLTCSYNQRDQCFDMLRTTYKFYLSFENAFCPDYVTEKLFNALRYDVVPIVMGGADYSKFAPPNSYINVIDFQSPKHLADYLKLLNENDDLYSHYFDWKKDYTIELWTTRGWCSLCKLLHDPTTPHNVYADLQEWWMKDGQCATAWSKQTTWNQMTNLISKNLFD